MHRLATLCLCAIVAIAAIAAPTSAQTYNGTGIYFRQGGYGLVISPSAYIEWLPSVTDSKLTTAIIAGGGTTASPLTTSSASTNFFDFRTQSTDATGADSRGIYWRHYAAGVNCSADCFRPFMTVTGSGATAARGVHSSLSFSGTGSLSGEGDAIKGTLQIPAGLGGTACAVCANLNLQSSGTVTGNASGVRFVLDGNTTAVTAANTNTGVGVMSVEGVTITSGGLVHTSTNTATHGMRILINGAVYEILLKAL
jgi:hypothetical protein